LKITGKDVEQAALMSRLELTEEEKAAYTKSLNAIMGHLDVLKELDTGAAEPAAHVLPIKNVFREDKPEPSLDKELVLANAPDVEAGAFKVPRIV
jgi:aspartyl-tRNA(Asn)/glutamyl-tRNA(Gln) amidotransferase subunit C